MLIRHDVSITHFSSVCDYVIADGIVEKVLRNEVSAKIEDVIGVSLDQGSNFLLVAT